MVVSPKHPKMIIFSRKTHGCWVPLFSETPKWLCTWHSWHRKQRKLHPSCTLPATVRGASPATPWKIFARQNAKNTTGDPTNCTCIIIQSTFSIYKTYNTNTFILYIHRFSFPVAAAVIIKSEVPGICHLVVVNLAHPRARHGLREFSKHRVFPGGWSKHSGSRRSKKTRRAIPGEPTTLTEAERCS